jgi:hypothetical protein
VHLCIFPDALPLTLHRIHTAFEVSPSQSQKSKQFPVVWRLKGGWSAFVAGRYREGKSETQILQLYNATVAPL